MNNYFIIKFFMGLKLNYSTLLICSKKKRQIIFYKISKRNPLLLQVFDKKAEAKI